MSVKDGGDAAALLEVEAADVCSIEVIDFSISNDCDALHLIGCAGDD